MIEFERVEAESWDCLTKYSVRRDGVLLGFVKKVEVESYRKAGRIIMQTFHPKEWRWERPDGTGTRCGSYSREAATRELVETIDRESPDGD
jgi:hypothetical protein